MDDPSASPNSSLSGAVRIIPPSEGVAETAVGSPPTPFSPTAADSDIGNLLRSSIVGRYPTTKSEEWTLLDLTDKQIQRIADVYERLLSEKEDLQRRAARVDDVLILLRRPDTRKNREWNSAIDAVFESLDKPERPQPSGRLL